MLRIHAVKQRKHTLKSGSRGSAGVDFTDWKAAKRVTDLRKSCDRYGTEYIMRESLKQLKLTYIKRPLFTTEAAHENAQRHPH
jgi:hypothetical protein